MNLAINFNDYFININIHLIELLGIFLILTSIMVLVSKNNIYSIFFLILSFINATNLLIINNIEYLAILFVIIYIGAIAILFLFIIMLLNIKLIKFKNNYSIINSLVLSFIILILIFLYYKLIKDDMFLNLNLIINQFYIDSTSNKFINWSYKFINLNSFNILGYYLYNNFLFEVIISGYLLLIALLGSINLTLNNISSFYLKKQFTYLQINQEIIFKIKRKYIIFENKK